MTSYNGYLIDLDGTMYRGSEVIEGAIEFVDALVVSEVPYLFLTNNSSKTQADVASHLNGMGIKATAENIMTTSIATAKYISNQKSRARCYVIGESGIKNALEQEGLILADTDCDYVVFGIDRQITYEKYATACLEVRNGATFISTNSDNAIPTERGLLPGNGALTSVITISTNQDPIFIGKPESVIMSEALKVLGTEKADTLMVGDNYNTDIKAGLNNGIDTLMVFTGVTPFSDYPTLEVKPTYHVQNLVEWIPSINK